MNEVRSLIQFVSRNFYPKAYILVLDAVLTHSVLSDDDLTYLMGIQRKELRAICNKLVEDRLLVVHAQREEEGNQQRFKTKVYYYIHFTEAIDSIKWKIHTIVKQLKDEIQKESNPEGYVCRRCHARYSQIDALSMLSADRSHFVCDRCGDELIEDDSGVKLKMREAKLHSLMSQINPIIDYLRKIDKMTIEENTFESSLTRAIPAQSETRASYTASNRTVRNTANNFVGNFAKNRHFNSNSGTNAILNVKISNEDDEALDQEAALKRKHEKAIQNALPTWHSGSTVGKSGLGRLDDDEKGEIENNREINDEAANASGSATPNLMLDENQTPPTDATTQVSVGASRDQTPMSDSGFNINDQEAEDALAAYYANLEKQQAEDDDDEDEDDDDDDDEDDEFEDVMDQDEDSNENSQPQAASVPTQAPELSQSNGASAQQIEIEEFDGESDED